VVVYWVPSFVRTCVSTQSVRYLSTSDLRMGLLRFLNRPPSFLRSNRQRKRMKFRPTSSTDQAKCIGRFDTWLTSCWRNSRILFLTIRYGLIRSPIFRNATWFDPYTRRQQSTTKEVCRSSSANSTGKSWKSSAFNRQFHPRWRLLTSTIIPLRPLVEWPSFRRLFRTTPSFTGASLARESCPGEVKVFLSVRKRGQGLKVKPPYPGMGMHQSSSSKM